MAEDTAEQYHYPPKQTEEFPLHGRVSNRPARLVGYGERWDGDECVLWAEGESAAGLGLRRAAAPAAADRGARRGVAPADRTTRSRTSASTGRRTCSSTTSTSASRSSTRGRSCSCPRGRSERSRRASGRGLPTLDAPGPGFVEQVVRARERRRARRHGARRGREPRASGSAPTRCTDRDQLPHPLHVADARRGHLRRRHRAVHEPHRRAASTRASGAS